MRAALACLLLALLAACSDERESVRASLDVGDLLSAPADPRFERGALDLAGARATPWRVWLRDWSVEGDLDAGNVRLRAQDGDLELDLALRSTSALVKQGERGLSRKGAAPGNASHYYSIPRMRSEGTLALRGERRAVSGESWFDREWSTSALEEGQVGWDWFALRLDDGSELMLYRMRRSDGSLDPFSSAMFTRSGLEPRALGSSEFTLRETARWTSPSSGASYPSRWTIEVPALGLACEVEPLVADCELRVAVRYWEGAVRVSGTLDARAISGRGFVELTGY